MHGSRCETLEVFVLMKGSCCIGLGGLLIVLPQPPMCYDDKDTSMLAPDEFQNSELFRFWSSVCVC